MKKIIYILGLSITDGINFFSIDFKFKEKIIIIFFDKMELSYITALNLYKNNYSIGFLSFSNLINKLFLSKFFNNTCRFYKISEYTVEITGNFSSLNYHIVNLPAYVNTANDPALYDHKPLNNHLHLFLESLILQTYSLKIFLFSQFTFKTFFILLDYYFIECILFIILITYLTTYKYMLFSYDSNKNLLKEFI
jgi:hypothetical protein